MARVSVAVLLFAVILFAVSVAATGRGRRTQSRDAFAGFGIITAFVLFALALAGLVVAAW